MSNWRKVDDNWINFDNLLEIFIQETLNEKDDKVFSIYSYDAHNYELLFKREFLTEIQAQNFLSDFMGRAC